jgi:ribose 5-phosphate isomerase B
MEGHRLAWDYSIEKSGKGHCMNNSFPRPMTPKVRVIHLGLAADHAGLALKTEVAAFLAGMGLVESKDFGATTLDQDDDFPDFVAPLARAVASGEVKRGVAICGSGVGACILANKIPGVRACLCHDSYSARQGVEHNDMNLLTLGARVIGPGLARELIMTFLGAGFLAEPRHVRRLQKIAEVEAFESC